MLCHQMACEAGRPVVCVPVPDQGYFHRGGAPMKALIYVILGLDLLYVALTYRNSNR